MRKETAAKASAAISEHTSDENPYETIQQYQGGEVRKSSVKACEPFNIAVLYIHCTSIDLKSPEL